MIDSKCNRVKLVSYITGNLKEESISAIEEHISQCRKCREFVHSFEEKQSDYLDKNPFNTIIHKKDLNNQKGTYLFFNYKKPIYALAATLVLCVFSVLYYSQKIRKNEVSVKGKKAMIHLYVQTKEGDILRKDAHRYFPDERIQFSYTNTGFDYFALFSMNQSYEVSLLFPIQEDSTANISKGADIPLPYSLILDEALGEVLYIGFFCEKKLSIHEIAEIFKKAKQKGSTLSQFIIEESKDYQAVFLLTEKIEKVK